MSKKEDRELGWDIIKCIFWICVIIISFLFGGSLKPNIDTILIAFALFTCGFLKAILEEIVKITATLYNIVDKIKDLSREDRY